MDEKDMIQTVLEIHGKVHETANKVSLIGADVSIVKAQNLEINEGMKKAITKLTDSIDVQTRVFNLATLSLQSMADSKQSDATSTNSILKYGAYVLVTIVVAICLVSGLVVVKDLHDILNQVMKLKMGVTANGL